MMNTKTFVQLLEDPISEKVSNFTCGWSGKTLMEIYFYPEIAATPLGYLTCSLPDISGPLAIYSTSSQPFSYVINWVDGQPIQYNWYSTLTGDHLLNSSVQLFFKFTRL